MPRVSEQYKDDQRAHILAAARRCFVRNGFHRTSMQDVFAEAGRSAGAVYRYYPRKDDLILAVARDNLARVGAALRTALPGTPPGRTEPDSDARDGAELGVGDVLAALLTAVAELHADRQLAAVALMVWSESLRTPELAAELTATTTAMSRELAELVGRQQRRGAWPGVRADAIAAAALAVLPGFLLSLALGGPDAVSDVPDAVRALWP